MTCKTALFSAFCLILLRSGASAQTAVTTTGGTANTIPLFTSGSSVGNSVINQSNGNVGINTGVPAYPLDVIGNIKLRSNGADATGILLGSDGGGHPQLQFNAADNSERFRLQVNDINLPTERLSLYAGPLNQNATTETLVLGGNGNVGIGTTSPQARFDVTGNSATFATGTEEEFHITRLINDGVSFPQVASFQLGTWNTSGACCGPQTRLDINLKSTPTGALTGDTNVMSLLSSGNVGIGSTTPGARLEVNGNVKLTAGSGSSVTFPDNTVQSTAWNGTTFGGDYAESVDLTGPREDFGPGDVLVVDTEHPGKFLKASSPYSTLVAGIYSTKPGLVGRRISADQKDNATAIPMAMVGIVPTKVTAENGPIKTGDILVASSLPGYAMKGTDRSLFSGAIIGKALGKLEAGSGVIEVLVSLQ